jgi:hypothetical protein
MKTSPGIIAVFGLMIAFFSLQTSAQVSVNADNSTPDPSAMLDVKSTTTGMLVPRMTAAQRDLITSPANGLLIFCTDNNQYYSNQGTPAAKNWVMVNSQWLANGTSIYYNAGNVGIGTTVPHAPLQLENQVANRRIVLWEMGNNDHQFYGLGISPSIFRYQVDATSASHVFYAGATATTSNELMRIQGDGKVGIGTATPSASAALDVSSTTRGFLPPRMTAAQIAAIASPTVGLTVFNTSDEHLYVYTSSPYSWVRMAYENSLLCTWPFTVTHRQGSVAPFAKTVTYGTTLTSLSGALKCWITQNLGAEHQATSATDATEASAGWYWQFNRKQGYYNDGTTLSPAWTITSISENSDWQSANDPCLLLLGPGWRIPTYTEWDNADISGGWDNSNETYASVLKLHAAGYLYASDGLLSSRGSHGFYWGSKQYSSTYGWFLYFWVGNSAMFNDSKADGFPVRCLRDM